MTQIDPGPNGAFVRQKAIREPAGFQAGPNSLRFGVLVSCLRAVPSERTVNTSACSMPDSVVCW